MLVKEFLNGIENNYTKYFNGSVCKAQLQHSLGESIVVSCYLAQGREELSNGYFENDMIKVRFWIHDMPKGITLDDEMPEKITLQNQSKSFNIKADVDYMYCSSQSVPFRKVNNTPQKVIITLDKFFKSLHDAIEQAYKENKTMECHNELIKKRLK